MRNYLQWKTCFFYIHKRTKLKINNELVVFLSTKSHESDRTFDSNFKIAKEEDFAFLFSITLGPLQCCRKNFLKMNALAFHSPDIPFIEGPKWTPIEQSQNQQTFLHYYWKISLDRKNFLSCLWKHCFTLTKCKM